jgi:hypothetical protein
MTCPKKCCSLKYARFFASVVVSVIALIICILGMAGLFPKTEPGYFTSLLTLIIGLWTGISAKGYQIENQETETPYQSLESSESPSSTPPPSPEQVLESEV